GASDAESSDDDILFSLQDAEEVWRLLEKPEDYEIVYVERTHFTSEYDELGYDVGYWGGDHFSLIADAAVMPRWHPPDEDDFLHLAERLRSLNEHALFATPAEAAAFRKYYKSRSWAET